MCSRFSSDPVSRLSMQMTRSPPASRYSQRCEPRKPAPPVTRQVGIYLRTLTAVFMWLAEPAATAAGPSITCRRIPPNSCYLREISQFFSQIARSSGHRDTVDSEAALGTEVLSLAAHPSPQDAPTRPMALMSAATQDLRPSCGERDPSATSLFRGGHRARRRGIEGFKSTARRYSLCTEDAEDAYQRALEILLTKAPTRDRSELRPGCTR